MTNQSKIVPPDSIKPTANARPRYESSTEAKERHKHQENIVWSYVWRRRVVYFLTVIASLHLALYPLVLALPDSAELTTRLRPLSDLIRLVALVLPSGLDRWIRAYAGDPTWFLVSAGAVGGLMWASAQVRGRITDEMTANWRASFTNAHRTPSPRTGALSPFSFSWLHKFIFAILLFIVVYRPLVWIAPSIPTYLWTPLSAFLDRMAAGIIWFLVVATTLALLLPTKVIARFRTRPEYKRTVLNIKRKYAPLLFAVLLPLIGLAFASHYLFNIRDSFGSFCEESRVNGETIRSTNRGLKICTEANRANCARIKIDETARPACGSNCTGKVLEFDTRSLCTATGIFLEKGARYHLLLEQKGPWTFAWTPSDTRGMPIEAFDPPDNSPLRAQIKSYAIKLLMLTMYPLKRTFDRPWGHVITRYGSTGTEENFIDPGEERRADRREELFTPTRDGEMFIYLNQPVLGLWADALGFFNSGTAVVTVTRVPRR